MSPTRLPKAVIFDLDGTLVDSAADIAVALNGAFKPLGVGPFSTADVMAMVGGGSSVLIDRAAVRAGYAFDGDGKAELYRRFMDVYKQVSSEGRGLYEGARETLGTLRASGVHIGLCTNKPAAVTEIAVRALGIGSLFDVVVGARDDVAKKPDPAMLRACLDPFDIKPGEAVMVGDSAADHGAARAAGARIVLVDFGYSKVPVASLQPDAVISHLAELPATLGRLARV